MKKPDIVSIDETMRLHVSELHTHHGTDVVVRLQMNEDGRWMDYGPDGSVRFPKEEGVLRDLAAVFAREWDALVTERIQKAMG